MYVDMSVLFFSKGNAKLGKEIYTFSLPSGFTCPGAVECLSRANRETGKIVDGKQTLFRCFSASQETLYPVVRVQRWKNFDALSKLSRSEMVALIASNLPKKARIVRVHVAGDFFNEEYFLAWMDVASMFGGVVFYAYTKSVNMWVKHMDKVPRNFVLTASFGGRYDNLIEQHKLKYAKVVYSVEQAKELNLAIDHDDTHAYLGVEPFALLLHGTQPKQSDASVALQKLRKQGIGGYGKQKQKRIEANTANKTVE